MVSSITRSSPRVAIDAGPLLYPGMGIWRVTASLIEAMLNLDMPCELKLFARHLRGGTGSNEFHGRTIHRVHLSRDMAEIVKLLGVNEWLIPAELYHATNHYLPLKRPDKAIVTIHDLIFMLSPEAQFSDAHRFFASKVPNFARRCARVIAISESTRSDIIKHLGIPAERIDVVPWAVDRRIFSPAADDRALRVRLKETQGIDFPYFLAVSCSEGRKNTPRLLEAYAKFLERSPKNHLVVVWNDCPPEIKKKYQNGALANHIHFGSQISDDKLVDLYRGATAMAFPSSYEGFGLPILEAMSCGTPVITAKNSSIPEVAGDAAKYVDPLSVDSMVNALEQFENDSSLGLTLREKGYEQANKFSWERTARLTLDVYRKALNDLGERS